MRQRVNEESALLRSSALSYDLRSTYRLVHSHTSSYNTWCNVYNHKHLITSDHCGKQRKQSARARLKAGQLCSLLLAGGWRASTPPS